MKLTILLLTAAFFNTHATGVAQNVTISGKNLTLKQVFSAIEKQTGYVVFNKQGLLSNAKTVSLSVYDIPLSDVLEVVLKDQSLNFVIRDRTIILSRKAETVHMSVANPSLSRSVLFDEPVSLITGRVTDSIGIPLEKASVLIKKTKKSTFSGRDGSFTIDAKEGDIILVSYIGYETHSVVVTPSMLFAANNVVIVLKPLAVSLGEVEVIVNTGYQAMRTKDITGAVDVVTNQMLQQQTGLNIIDRLNNITSAIRFDTKEIRNRDLQKLNFSVRGLSTINGNLDPLIVLDGFIYEGDIHNIDPNNVESMTILKDAAASSIWGARAGNGVILITSKKGAFQAGQKTKISLSNTTITNEKPDLKQLYEIPNKDFIEMEEMLFNKGYYFGWLNFAAHMSMSPAVNLFNNRQKGLISAEDSAKTMDWLLAQDGRQNYMDEFYNTPFSNQLSLNINGGGEFNSYGFGMGYTTDRTHLDANNKKLNIQLSVNRQPKCLPLRVFF